MKFLKAIGFSGINPDRRAVEKINGIENSYIPRSVSIPVYIKKGTILVKNKERVSEGQVIGIGENGESHSSIPGIVYDIKDFDIDGVIYKTVFIKLSGEFDITGKNITKFTWETLKSQTVIDMFINNGVNGYKKDYDFVNLIKKGIQKSPMNHLIINAFDLDFSIYNVFAIIKYKTKKIIQGIKILKYLLSPSSITVVIENDYVNFIDEFKKSVEEEKLNINIKFLKNQYPKSSDFLIYRAVTKNSYYSYEDIIEANDYIVGVETVYLIEEALVLQKPIIEKIITVKDEDVIKIYNVKIGKNILELIQEFKKITSKKIVIGGGVVVGEKILTLDRPITKDLDSITLLPDKGDKKQVSCINCSLCIRACPNLLNPIKLYKIISDNLQNSTQETLKCINCKACSYVCPSNIPLAKTIYNKRIEIEKQDN